MQRRERAAAPTPAGSARILEGEAGTLHRGRVVDDDAVDVLRRERIDEDPVLALIDDEIVFGGGILDEQTVLEAAAPARLHAHAETAGSGIDALLRHELLDLFARDGRDGHQDIRLTGRAHGTSLV